MSGHTRPTAAFTALALSIGLAAAARAEEPSTKKAAPTSNAPAAKAPAAPGPGTGSMIVVRDAETGRLRLPTAEEEQRLSRTREALARTESAEPLKVITKPDGSKMIDLGDRFMSLSVARRGADGKIEQGCFDDPKRAEEFLAAPAPAAAAAKRPVDSQPLEEK